MPKVTNKAKPAWGRALAARRTYLGKSLMDVERETDGAIYTALLNRVENGYKHIDDLKLREYRELIRALEWTPLEFQEATGADLNLSAEKTSEDHALVPAYTTLVDAARKRGTPLRRAYDHDDTRRAHDPTRLVAALTDELTWRDTNLETTIPPGAWLLIEIGAKPEPGTPTLHYSPDLLAAVLLEHHDDADVRLLRRIARGVGATATNQVRLEPAGPVRAITAFPARAS